MSKIDEQLRAMGEYKYYVDHQMHVDPEHVISLTTRGNDHFIIGCPTKEEASDYILEKVSSELFWRCGVISDRKQKSL